MKPIQLKQNKIGTVFKTVPILIIIISLLFQLSVLFLLLLEVLHFKTTIKLIIVDNEYDEVCKKEYGVGNNEYIIVSNAFKIK